ncbi:hypothetical protein BpHYR1_033554 [Brachionus plicatilis]|uniref:Uncharacterized protein n=1 Tax=Brachionus plicatilis TaxID=10195 RepID=A0A3M7T384_BRAPC|nr:hypothetical protein BpHYR1_033554 [Brachionus plicatilis]
MLDYDKRIKKNFFKLESSKNYSDENFSITEFPKWKSIQLISIQKVSHDIIRFRDRIDNNE